jgi:hypothetical protein
VSCYLPPFSYTFADFHNLRRSFHAERRCSAQPRHCLPSSAHPIGRRGTVGPHAARLRSPLGQGLAGSSSWWWFRSTEMCGHPCDSVQSSASTRRGRRICCPDPQDYLRHGRINPVADNHDRLTNYLDSQNTNHLDERTHATPTPRAISPSVAARSANAS